MNKNFKKMALSLAISSIFVSATALAVESGGVVSQDSSVDAVYFNCSGTIIGGNAVLTTTHCEHKNYTQDAYVPYRNGLGYQEGKVDVNHHTFNIVPNSFALTEVPNIDEVLTELHVMSMLSESRREKLKYGRIQLGVFKLTEKPMFNLIHIIQNNGISKNQRFSFFRDFKPVYLKGFGGNDTDHEELAKGLTTVNKQNECYENQGCDDPNEDLYRPYSYQRPWLYNNDGNFKLNQFALIAYPVLDKTEDHYLKGWNVGGDSGAPFLNRNAEIVGVNYGVIAGMRNGYHIADDLGDSLRDREIDLLLKEVNGWHYPTYISTANGEGQLYPSIQDNALEKNDPLRQQLQNIKAQAKDKLQFSDQNEALRTLAKEIVDNADNEVALPTHTTIRKVEKDASGQSVFTVTIQSLHKDTIKPSIFTEGDVQIIESTNTNDCNTLDDVKPYDVCTLKITSNGGQGKIILGDNGEEILVNPDLPKKEDPSDEDETTSDTTESGDTSEVMFQPIDDTKGGSMGFLSGIVLAGVAVARRLLSKENKK